MLRIYNRVYYLDCYSFPSSDEKRIDSVTVLIHFAGRLEQAVTATTRAVFFSIFRGSPSTFHIEVANALTVVLDSET